MNKTVFLYFRICVVLLTHSIPEHDEYRNTFRKYATEHPDFQHRVRYTYIYADVQKTFVSRLTNGQAIENKTSLKVSDSSF